jgi:hypothetical protein
MPEMIASHFFASRDAMMASKPVFWNLAGRPSRFATSVPMSMSDPTALVPW